MNTNKDSSSQEHREDDEFINSLFNQINEIENADKFESLQLYEACHKNNLGTVVGRLVVDTHGRFLRVINNVIYFCCTAIDGDRQSFIKDDGRPDYIRLFWAGSSNYEKRTKSGEIIKQLTPEESTLNDKLETALRKLGRILNANKYVLERMNRKIWVNEYSKNVVLFMMVQQHHPKRGGWLDFTRCIPSYLVHRASGFDVRMARFLKQKLSELQEPSLLTQSISRDPEDCRFLLRIDTHRPKNYKIELSLEENNGDASLTPDVLHLMEDLDKYWIPVDVFDADEVKRNIEFVQKITAEVEAVISESNKADPTYSLSDLVVSEQSQKATVEGDSSLTTNTSAQHRVSEYEEATRMANNSKRFGYTLPPEVAMKYMELYNSNLGDWGNEKLDELDRLYIPKEVLATENESRFRELYPSEDPLIFAGKRNSNRNN